MGRVVARSLVELLITVGAVIVLFTVYTLYWTNVTADAAMGGEMSKLQHAWQQQAAASPTPQSGGGSGGDGVPVGAAHADGQAYAIVYIPRLGKDWKKPLVEGVSTGDLEKGIGHYAGTAQLGGLGNFAIAGHRRTNGNPLDAFPTLRPGDDVVIDDGHYWYTYVLDRHPYRTLPTDVQVLDAVPAHSGFTTAGRYLTITTCDPPWGHTYRLIEWGHLVSVSPVADGTPAALRS